jgi:HK97 family phage major capsid protein
MSDEQNLRDEVIALDEGARDRRFDADEKDRWNTANEQLEEIEKRRERVRELAGNPRAVVSGVDDYNNASYRRGPRLDDQAPAHVRAGHDAGLRAIERNAGRLAPDATDRLDDLVRERDPAGLAGRYLDAVASPDYLSAFGKMVADPTSGHLRFTPRETEAVQKVSAIQAERVMSIGTGSAGGFAVPYVLDPSIILSGSGALNPVRTIAKVITIEASREWRGVSSDGVVAGYVAEGTEATDGSPTLVQPTIVTAQWRVFVPFSIELGQDWAALTTELGRLAADARDVNDATQFLSGNGSNAPGGILNIGGTGGLTTSQRVQTAGVAAFAVGDPWLLSAAIPPRFRAATTYAAAPPTWDTAYRFVGTNSTEPYQFSNGDRGGNFLGQAKVEWSAMDTGATTGKRLIIGGDWQSYGIVDRLGTTAELIPHLFGATNRFPTGQRGLYVYGRTGAGVLAPNAFRFMEVK